jgi:tetratricopeptide (TPR) repeat protein
MIRIIEKVFQALARACEWPLSRRGLPLTFLLCASVLVFESWLRPPLSKDLRAFQIPFGIWKQSVDPAIQLDHPPQFLLNSIGTVLIVLLAVEFMWLLRRPEHLPRAAGLLLVAALAGNAAAAFNHPALVERMDMEYEQRRQFVEGFHFSLREEEPLSRRDNSRINELGDLLTDTQRGDLARGLVYLRFGWWLIPCAAFGVLLGTAIPFRSRCRQLAGWTLVAIPVAGLVCSQRLAAEYYWQRSQALEDRCQYSAARAALDRSVNLFPELRSLQRTWLLAGKIDNRLGQPSSEEKLFRAYQYARDRQSPRMLTYRQDLPWTIPGVDDFRSGLSTIPCGVDRSLSAGIAYTGAEDTEAGLLPRKPGPVDTATLMAMRASELRWAVAISDELLGDAASGPAASAYASRLWTDVGIQEYLVGQIDKSPNQLQFEDSHTLSVAQGAWQRAADLAPTNRESLFLLGYARARLDPAHPERAEPFLRSILDDSGDLTLRGDILSILGDSYFHAGQYEQARKCYIQSFDLYNVPQAFRNFRAQRRLGGV